MTWHLKDRELERKLVGLYPSFLDDLKFGVMNIGNRHCVNVECTRVRGNEDIPNDTVSFWDDELEEDPEYDQNSWSEYPKTEPTGLGVYRLEVKHSAESSTQCFAAVFDFSGFDYLSKTSEKSWFVYGQGNIIDTDVLDGGYVRYRPWED